MRGTVLGEVPSAAAAHGIELAAIARGDPEIRQPTSAQGQQENSVIPCVSLHR